MLHTALKTLFPGIHQAGAEVALKIDAVAFMDIAFSSLRPQACASPAAHTRSPPLHARRRSLPLYRFSARLQ